MRIRLEKVGPYTCLPLPEAAANSTSFAAGSEVEVVWDEKRSQLIVRSLGTRLTPDAKGGNEAAFVDEFLNAYVEAMQNLASL